jgi:energy-coupling factor transporter transmembrane protein EcfT
MDELKTKWEQMERPVRLAIIVAAVVLGLLIIVKILPALVTAMGVGLFLAILFVPYWVPTIIAFVRKHPSTGGIAALNFFFGWTFVGWVVALAWSLSDNTARGHTVIVNTTVAGGAGTVAGTPPPPQHQVGDVVNGHRFDGVSWIPMQAAPTPPPQSPPPAVGSGQAGV